MRYLSYIGMLIGLAVMVILVAWQGLQQVFGILLGSGWALLLLPLIWLPNLLPAAASWRLLFDSQYRPSYPHILVALWMGRSVNSLLPVATIGGEVVKARVLTLWGTSGARATASVVVDKTVQVFALIIWGLIGVGLLVNIAADNHLASYALAGFAVLAVCIIGFAFAQHAGMFSFVVKFGGKFIKADYWNGLADGANAIDVTVREIYARGGDVLKSVLLRVVQLVIQSGEVWLACLLLGHPIGFFEAMLLKSLTSTISDVAFIVPNAYGVQEGAFMMIGTLLGMPADFSLAVSLAVRIREVFIDIPGLLAWQLVEGRTLLARANATK